VTTYRSPSLTVDIIIEHEGGVVLIERRNPPHGYALPGGFVDYGETVEAAAIREAREETSLHVQLRGLLGIYSDPARDARQHTVSAVFVASASGELKAADDAVSAMVAKLDALPSPLCFDHARILADYAAWQRSGATVVAGSILTDEDRRTIADLAWQTLSAVVALPISSVRSAFRRGPLSQPGACHVTIKNKRGDIRGSAGSTTTSATLALAVEEITAAAAISQPQAPILRGEISELHIEISVLGFTTDVIIATND
jgi:8-oxo-dGTP diphosphatase